MTPETVFSIVNAIAFFSWVYLITAARWTPALFRIVRFAVPILFALVYVTAMVLAEPNQEGGFQTLAQVTSLFTQPWVVVAAWLHYLAFVCGMLDPGEGQGRKHWSRLDRDSHDPDLPLRSCWVAALSHPPRISET